ncbi:undecaprenyl/decaprenyl-phosphate alpha-N-acetylglucosaminyl 1-phosphate transferase [bacterium]|nr:undecaprenyl/decaprenyl-phosphate alpha-N-acetylglucosaminyl 1-phosphate transferase [Mariniblastus sp.]MDB4380042.1 undecaprenyl/decaprenyl-phosphate alpha-N-acetylglucosaminyl 1-phosphate transferase [Mariniblastus sp.]MDB4473280.1 undecaprenyl/decaprenyl-phosphate alpha-N-acetylglucosaminyl 1-phosphate transferase [bacterium]MDB4483779.1 undecaprenyl/decaprenyl-phosphate alpha-N-acetylglucosaminyl 1-phosphate transferase [bacterium]
MLSVIFAFFVSIVGAILLVPRLAVVARRWNVVDRPDRQRKLHNAAIPMVGGVAVLLTMILAIPLSVYGGAECQFLFGQMMENLLARMPFDLDSHQLTVRSSDYFELTGLLIGSIILVGVGVLDDRFQLRGRQKLFGQAVAVTTLIIFGYHFSEITVAGFKIEFGIFSVLFVYAWVLAAINSVNLLDGADGIAGTIGVVMSLALSVMAIIQEQWSTALIAASMAGALAGFLRFNFPPAKVYLGDAGSMLIGFVLSALAIRCTFKQNSAIAFFAPVALLAIPFLDSAAAVIRRRLMGRSIFEVDRGHLHHSLMKRGYSPRVSLLWVTLLCTTTAAGAVLSLLNQQPVYALASILIVVVVMIASKVFGVAEYQLISRRASTIAKSFFKMPSTNGLNYQQASVHVQGSRDWQDVWKMLCAFADTKRLNEITLDLNAPWMHESFHATLRRSDANRGDNQQWYSQIPLVSDGRVFGRVEVYGPNETGYSHQQLLVDLMDVTALIEKTMLSGDEDLISESGDLGFEMVKVGPGGDELADEFSLPSKPR